MDDKRKATILRLMRQRLKNYALRNKPAVESMPYLLYNSGTISTHEYQLIKDHLQRHLEGHPTLESWMRAKHSPLLAGVSAKEVPLILYQASIDWLTHMINELDPNGRRK